MNVSAPAEPPSAGPRSTDMRLFVLILLVLASVAFVASSMGFALSSPDGVGRLKPLLTLDARPPDLAPIARPVGIALQALLAVVWAAVLIHALRAILTERRLRARHRLHRAPRLLPYTATAHPSFILALAAGAAWPPLTQLPVRWPSLIMAAVMMACAIWAAVERQRRRGPRLVLTSTVEIFAGWATTALYASFAALLMRDLGLSLPLAAVVSILLLMVTTVEVQLRLGHSVAYGFTVIWALIGIAAHAMQNELTVATAAIVAIAAIVAVLVREMS